MRLPPRPTIYEINAAVWLERLGRDGGRPLTLAEVPDAAWDAIAALHRLPLRNSNSALERATATNELKKGF